MPKDSCALCLLLRAAVQASHHDVCSFPKEELPANIAYQLIKDHRQLDANPRLNLASFVTTFMEPEAEKLIAESQNVNFVSPCWLAGLVCCLVS